MGVIAKGIPRGCQGLFTPVSLGYPLSVFNKNSTLNGARFSKSYIARRMSAMMGSPPGFYDTHIGFLSKCAASGRLSVLEIGLRTQLL